MFKTKKVSKNNTNSSLKLITFAAGRGSSFVCKLLSEIYHKKPGRILEINLIIGDKKNYLTVENRHEDINLIYLYENLDPYDYSAVDFGKLKIFERKYGVPNLWPLIRCARNLETAPYEKKVTALYHYLDYFEKLYQKFKPDIYFSGDIDCLPAWAAHQVFSRNGVECLHFYCSRINERIQITDNPFDQIPFLKEIFLRKTAASLTVTERELTAQVKGDYVKRQARPAYYFRSTWRKLFQFVKVVRSLRDYFKYDNFFDYSLKDRLRRATAMRKNAILNGIFFRLNALNKLENKKYFYFPLHVEPEIALSIRGRSFANQLKVIELVSASLPIGVDLLVKEHPSMPAGRRSTKFYRKIAKLTNVRLLKTGFDSFNLLKDKNCCGVITVSGTTGYEGLFFSKPAIIFGEVFYQVYEEGVIKVDHPNDLRQAVIDVINGKGISFKKFDSFIGALFERTYPGIWNFDTPTMSESKNIDRLANNLLTELLVRETAHAK